MVGMRSVQRHARELGLWIVTPDSIKDRIMYCISKLINRATTSLVWDRPDQLLCSVSGINPAHSGRFGIEKGGTLLNNGGSLIENVSHNGAFWGCPVTVRVLVLRYSLPERVMCRD